MAEDSQKGPQEPNLELPSLFGRGRKKKQKAGAPEAPTDAPLAPTAPTASTTDDAPARPALVPTGTGRRLPPSAPPPSTTRPPADTPQPAVKQPAAKQPAAAPAARRVPPPRTPTPAEPPARSRDRARTQPLATEPEAATQVAGPATGPDFAYDAPERTGATTLTEPAAGAPAEEAPPAKKARRRPALPSLSVGHPLLAAAVAGVVVGLVGVVLLSLVGRACSSVRGVDSCGGGLGLLALLAAAAVEVILGAVLLKGQQLSDPTSTSFLAVGMVAVAAMALFFGALSSAWMFLVLPLLTGVTFVIASWITTVFVEDPGS